MSARPTDWPRRAPATTARHLGLSPAVGRRPSGVPRLRATPPAGPPTLRETAGASGQMRADLLYPRRGQAGRALLHHHPPAQKPPRPELLRHPRRLVTSPAGFPTGPLRHLQLSGFISWLAPPPRRDRECDRPQVRRREPTCKIRPLLAPPTAPGWPSTHRPAGPRASAGQPRPSIRFLPGRTAHPLGAPPHRLPQPLGNPVQHSRSATDPPSGQLNSPNSRQSRSASASSRVTRHLAQHSHCRPPSAPPKAPATARQHPNSSPDHRACNSLPPLPLSSRPPSGSSVDSDYAR